MNKVLAGAALLGVGITLGLTGAHLWRPQLPPVPAVQAEKPLYWTDPMLPDYRSDRPGKSPMGMDLVPVYAEATQSGTVRIGPEVENNLGVRTTKVARGRLEDSIRTVGYVQFDQDRLVHIHARVEGWIEKLHVKTAGEAVTAGAPLFEIYAPTLVNAQEELLLALERDNPRLVVAAEARLRALEVPDALVEQVKRKRQPSRTVTVSAPQAGVVDRLEVREGFYIDPGMTVMSIGVLDPVWVEGELFERQAGLVRAGDTVTMTLDYLPGREWRGEVDYVYPVLDSVTRTVRIRMRFANPDRQLKPDMFAHLVVQLGVQQDVLLVPRDALIRTGAQDRLVLALGDGRFRSVPVTVGRVAREGAEILAGVGEGDRIVVSAQFLLDSESNKATGLLRMDHAPGHGDAMSPPSRTGPGHDHGATPSPVKDHAGHDRDSLPADEHAGHRRTQPAPEEQHAGHGANGEGKP